MGLENWEQDLAAYQAVLEDIRSGKLTIQQGEEEFLADLKQRIAALEAKINGGGASADGSPADRTFDGDNWAPG